MGKTRAMNSLDCSKHMSGSQVQESMHHMDKTMAKNVLVNGKILLNEMAFAKLYLLQQVPAKLRGDKIYLSVKNIEIMAPHLVLAESRTYAKPSKSAYLSSVLKDLKFHPSRTSRNFRHIHSASQISSRVLN